MLDQSLFSRERLAGYDPARISQGVALVVGAGALGQNTIQNLALSGIGEIRIVDKDRFEIHNRTRSPAYPSPDEQTVLGLGKAKVVAFKLHRLMSAANTVMRYANAWIQELGDGAFSNVSVVLSCVDNPRARSYLADKAFLHAIPLIEGGFDGPNITLSCYPAVNSEEANSAPCWRCSHQHLEGAFSCKFYAERAELEGVIPAIQNAASTLAGLQAEAAILALHKLMPLAYQALDLNLRTGKTRQIHLSKDPCCPGIHYSLDVKPLNLTTTANDPVRSLLTEISSYAGTNLTIQLPQPVIWTAFCTRCGNQVSPQVADWQWALSPLCVACGGPFSSSEENELTTSPIVYPELS